MGLQGWRSTLPVIRALFPETSISRSNVTMMFSSFD